MKLGVLAGIVCVALSVMFPIATAQATNCTKVVSTNGNQQAPGGGDTLTLSEANAAATAGDTVCLLPGTYSQVLQPRNNGTAFEPITFTSQNPQNPAILGGSGTEAVAVLNKSYVVLDNLTISPSTDSSGKWVWVVISGNNNTVKNSRFVRTTPTFGESNPKNILLEQYARGFNERAIGLNGSGAHHNLIAFNSFSGMNMGVHISKAGRGNIVRGNHFALTGQSGIVIGTSLSERLGTLIEENLIEWSLVEDGIQFMQDFGASDTTTDVSNVGAIVRNNTFRFNSENSIDLKGARDVVIENNVISHTIGSNNGAVEALRPEDNQRNCENPKVHQTVDSALPVFRNNRANTTAPCWNRISGASIDRGANASSQDVIIRNNIIYDNNSGVSISGPNYKVYNNTFLGNNKDFTGSNSSFNNGNQAEFVGINFVSAYNNIAIINNIFGGHNDAELQIQHSVLKPSTVINGNWFWNTPKLKIERQALTFVSFTDWKNLGYDRNGRISNPEFSGISSSKPTQDHSPLDFVPTASEVNSSGIALTTTRSEQSQSRDVAVVDAGFFTDGMGSIQGDQICIGSNQAASVESVNVNTNTIRITSPQSWGANAPVYLCSLKQKVGARISETDTPDPSPPVPPPPPASPTPPPTPPTECTHTADINGSGEVDIFDYNTLVAKFNPSATVTNEPADINCDSSVDIFDYNLLVAAFLNQNSNTYVQ